MTSKPSMQSIRRSGVALVAMLALASGWLTPTSAAEIERDACRGFKWPVGDVLAVFEGNARAQTAGKERASAARLSIDRLYKLELPLQSDVTFVMPPAKAMLPAGARAGILKFSVSQPGRYRVALDATFWIDVLLDDAEVKPRDFSGDPGCKAPHKIVEYDLPVGGEYMLQLRGAAQEATTIAIVSAHQGGGM